MAASRTPSTVLRRELFSLLAGERSRGVTLIAAPPGSGKTMLVRSWIEQTGLGDRVALVTVEPEEHDAQRFWISVVVELRDAIGADAFVERLEPMPSFDGDAVVARLVSELGTLEQPVVLVLDDLHELRSADALLQLKVLVTRRPPLLKIVLATRRDPRVGLHRLRLSDDLTEIRGPDLRFTLDETRQLLAGAGVRLSEESVVRLHERTEGWAAGLRLAAIALTGQSDPDRFVSEFSGSERHVADYLFSEVLDRQPDETRRLLLRTSILDRVDADLADALTGSRGSKRILQDLEMENAFVESLDASRSSFRYHRLFADLLRLELSRTAPATVPGLHHAASQWYASRGDSVEAIRHAQLGVDWPLAAGLIADHSLGLALDGRAATLQALLAGFPPNLLASDAELAEISAGCAIAEGSLADAERSLAVVAAGATAVPDERRPRFDALLALTRLMLARRRGDFEAALTEAESLLDDPSGLAGALDDDLRAATLLNLGVVELWSSRPADADHHLERALELARTAGRPYLEVQCLAHLAITAAPGSLAEGRALALQALALAEAHGWAGDRVIATAVVALGAADVWQGRFDDAEAWLARADGLVSPALDPAGMLLLHVARGRLNAGRGRYEQAAAEFLAAVDRDKGLVTPQHLTAPARRLLALMQVRLGDPAAAEATIAALPGSGDRADMWHVARAHAYLERGDPQQAVDVLAPVLSGNLPSQALLLVEAFLVDAAARDRLEDRTGAQADVERALELAEPDGLIWPFVVSPAREAIARHPRHATAYGAFLKDVLDVAAGLAPSAREDAPAGPLPDLTDGELRVLRYLPSNLTALEIGGELHLSSHTVKSHMKHIYAKLGVHRRTDAVARARELGLLGPTSRLR